MGTKQLATAVLDQKQGNTAIIASSDWPQTRLSAV